MIRVGGGKATTEKGLELQWYLCLYSKVHANKCG